MRLWVELGLRARKGRLGWPRQRQRRGGLQRYLPAAMPLLAPNVNSYRRLRRYSDTPINSPAWTNAPTRATSRNKAAQPDGAR